MKPAVKLFILITILFGAICPNAAYCSLFKGGSVSGGFFYTADINDLIPYSNIKVYKRWNEEDIAWKAWFRRGYLPIIAFLFTSFGIIVLLFINNFRLNKMVKKNFQDLWEAEENYYRLFEIVKDAIIIIDPKSSMIISVNQQAESITGHKREDLLDMSIDSLMLKSDEKRYNDFFDKIKTEGHTIASELTIANKSGLEKIVACKGRLIKGYNKTIILLSLSEHK